MIESLVADIRYGLRGARRAPRFAIAVAATIGLGLGVLGSGFTFLNAYVLAPVKLPDPYALYELTWDTKATPRHGFRLADFEAIRDEAPMFSNVAAGQGVTVMQNGVAMSGLLVSGNYFQLLGAQAALGRLLTPRDASAPGTSPVIVLTDIAWRARYGADRSIVGRDISIGRRRFEVVGVSRPDAALPGTAGIEFFAPLTMAQAFATTDPWADPDAASLKVVSRVRAPATAAEARAWLETFLRRRFPRGSDAEPIDVRLQSLATLLPLTGPRLTMFVLILSALGLVLLVACANVANLMLARGLSRRKEIAVRLALGASRGRVAQQVIAESLVLAGGAAAVGLALTWAAARVVPTLILRSFPGDAKPIEAFLVPLAFDRRVLALMAIATVASAVLVSLAPIARMARITLTAASRDDLPSGPRRSRLRAGLVAAQIAACVLFLVGASDVVFETWRVANPNPGLDWQHVADVRLAPDLRAAVAARLASDPRVERVAAAWRAPLEGTMQRIDVTASQTRIAQSAGFMVVSHEYFPLFGIRVVEGRPFTPLEAADAAPVVLVSRATARALWPGLDPIGRTLDVQPSARTGPPPARGRVRVIGVTEDVVNGTLLDGIDPTCVYFPTSPDRPGEMALLVRSRNDVSLLRQAVADAVDAVDGPATSAPFQFDPIRFTVGGLAWLLGFISSVASMLGLVGLLFAFSGTYAVVSFLVTERTREFGIRMALGARGGQIVFGLVAEMLRTASLGAAVGLAAVIALVPAGAGVLPGFPVAAPGAGAYAAGTIIVLVSTTIAAWVPSSRTTRIDPAQALRTE